MTRRTRCALWAVANAAIAGLLVQAFSEQPATTDCGRVADAALVAMLLVLSVRWARLAWRA